MLLSPPPSSSSSAMSGLSFRRRRGRRKRKDHHVAMTASNAAPPPRRPSPSVVSCIPHSHTPHRTLDLQWREGEKRGGGRGREGRKKRAAEVVGPDPLNGLLDTVSRASVSYLSQTSSFPSIESRKSFFKYLLDSHKDALCTIFGTASYVPKGLNFLGGEGRGWCD